MLSYSVYSSCKKKGNFSLKLYYDGFWTDKCVASHTINRNADGKWFVDVFGDDYCNGKYYFSMTKSNDNSYCTGRIEVDQ